MKRSQARRTNGRFTRNTLENTFGLRCIVCPKCRRMNPYGRKPVEPNAHGFIDPRAFNEWDVPTHCHACGEPLSAESEHF